MRVSQSHIADPRFSLSVCCGIRYKAISYYLQICLTNHMCPANSREFAIFWYIFYLLNSREFATYVHPNITAWIQPARYSSYRILEKNWPLRVEFLRNIYPSGANCWDTPLCRILENGCPEQQPSLSGIPLTIWIRWKKSQNAKKRTKMLTIFVACERGKGGGRIP